MTKRLLLAPVVALLSLGTACSSGPSQREREYRAALAETKISLRDSVGLAEDGGANGRALKADLARSGEPRFVVNTRAAEAGRQVEIDGKSGAIRANAASASPNDCPTAIAVSKAIEAAEARVGGQAVAVQPDDDDACNRQVLVLSDKLWEVKVAPNGAVLEVEEGDGGEAD